MTAAAPAPGYALVAAHGGAGAGTVADLLSLVLGPGAAVEPDANAAAAFADRPRHVLVLARRNAAGLGAAAVACTRLARHRPLLLLVADAPLPDPALVAYRIDALRSRVRAVITVPYLPALRGADRAADLAQHRKVRAAAAQLAEDLQRAAAGDPAPHRVGARR